MGLYSVPCRACGKMFMWFSGNLDQRCSDCIKAAEPPCVICGKQPHGFESFQGQPPHTYSPQKVTQP
jgi:hypothetical protein